MIKLDIMLIIKSVFTSKIRDSTFGETHAPRKKQYYENFGLNRSMPSSLKKNQNYLFIHFVSLDKLILIISKIYPYFIEIVFVTIKIAKFLNVSKVYLFLNINYSVCQCDYCAFW